MFGFYFIYWVMCVGWWISIPFGILFFFWLVTSPERYEKRRTREIAEYINSGAYEADCKRFRDRRATEELTKL